MFDDHGIIKIDAIRGDIQNRCERVIWCKIHYALSNKLFQLLWININNRAKTQVKIHLIKKIYENE